MWGCHRGWAEVGWADGGQAEVAQANGEWADGGHHGYPPLSYDVTDAVIC